MATYLPPLQDGWLPLFVLIAGVTALGNVVQCYTTLSYTQRLYSGSAPNTKEKTPAQTSPATPLSARTFGTWNIAVGVARIIAAYHLDERSWYIMSLVANLIGLWHFGTEAFVYKTCKPSGPWLAPMCVASTGVIWHVVQWNNYVRN